MEELQPTPLMINSTCFTIYRTLQQIEAEIIQFTNLPNNTPSLDLLAQHIKSKLVFIRNMLNAEIISKGTKDHDLLEIEGRLTELETEFYESNLHPVVVDDVSEDSESCFDNDRVDVSSVDEAPEVLNDVLVPRLKENVFECKGEVTGGGKRRRWWRTVAVLTTMSVALVVSFSGCLVSNQYEGFTIPT